MSRKYCFADEAGNFDFSPKGSKYYILGTVSMEEPAVGETLLRLRRDLAWRGMNLESTFHASEDPQVVRDAVFAVLKDVEFRCDYTYVEKSKTQPSLSQDWERFYKTLWFLHYKHVCPQSVTKDDELLVIAASLGIKSKRKAMRAAIADVVKQVAPCERWEVAFWPAESDPCLQIADYCTWAIQRKLEKGDQRSHDLISSKIATGFNPFAVGNKRYY